MGKVSRWIVTVSVVLIALIYILNPDARQLVPDAIAGGVRFVLWILLITTIMTAARRWYYRLRFGTDDRGFPVTNRSRASWRLNGWQRLGVVLSGLWFVFAVCVVTYRYTMNENNWFVHVAKEEPPPAPAPYPETEPTPAPAPAHVEAKSNEFDRKFDALPLASDAEVFGQELEAEEGLARELELVRCVAFVLAPIALGWIAAYAIVWAIAWVRAGFSENRAGRTHSRHAEPRD